MRVVGIDHIVMHCRDVEVTAEWYRDALGVSVQGYGAGRVALLFGEQKLNLRPVGAPQWGTSSQETPGALDICFVSDLPISDVMDDWRARGIPFHGGPSEKAGARGPMTSIYTWDPDRNLVEVASYEKE